MDDTLQEELDAVRSTLKTTANTPHPALSEFIQHELGQLDHLPLARIVLAAAWPAQDSVQQRERRISLASALELLRMALEIHKLLVAHAGSQDDLDKSLVGGTVLAGDYCFSRAAALAARTDNPQVVAIFSKLLQEVSEGNLRQLFQKERHFHETEVLYRAGALAGSTLAELPAHLRQSTADFSARLGHRAHAPGNTNGLEVSVEHAQLADFQRDRWQQIVAQGRL